MDIVGGRGGSMEVFKGGGLTDISGSGANSGWTLGRKTRRRGGGGSSVILVNGGKSDCTSAQSVIVIERYSCLKFCTMRLYQLVDSEMSKSTQRAYHSQICSSQCS